MGRDLAVQRIFEDLLDQALNPTAVAVVEQAAGIMWCDDAMAERAHRPLQRIDCLLAEQLRGQTDFAAALDVDQLALADKPAVPQGVRGEKVGPREERPVFAKNAKTVRGGITRNLEIRAIVDGRALDRDDGS